MRVALRTLAICGVAGLLGITVIAQDTSQSEQETAPAVIKQVKAEYTKEAMDARIEGTVRLEAAVLTDGSVGEVKVTRSLDTVHGLDDQAVKAVKQWLFKPGTKNGKAVPVDVSIEISFTLK